MKWIYLLALMIATPMLTALLKSKPRYLVHTCFLLGLSIFTLVPKLWVTPISWPGWPAPVQGLEFSIVDSVSIALILSTNKVRIPWRIKLSFGVICAAIVVSSFEANQLMPVAFYAWQLFRSVLLFYAIARVCGTVPSAPVALLSGLGLGLVYEAGLAASQFARGVPRPGGNLGHSNFLGLSSDFIFPPALALMLGTRRTLWPGLAVLSGLCIAVVGGSRATLGLFAAGCALTILFSLRQKVTSRKTAVAGAASLFLLFAAPAMWWGYSNRTEESTDSSDIARATMKLAAQMIIADHPLGVGADQYVIIANTGGYSQRAGVTWTEDTRTAPVHDTYYLVTAELGFLGLLGLIGLLSSTFAQGFGALRRPVADERMNILPGLLATLIIVAAHISYEWVFMYFNIHYLFAIAAGLVVATTSRAKSLAATTAQPARNALAMSRVG